MDKGHSQARATLQGGSQRINILILFSSPFDLQLAIILDKSIQEPEGRELVAKVHIGHLLKAENRTKTGE